MAADFSGEWISRYTYHDGNESGEHVVVFEGGVELEGHSLPQSDDSELSLHLAYDQETNSLTGTWREKTSPTGHYGGKVFHGALQLLLNAAGDQAAGKWVGFNGDLTQVTVGEWTILKKQP